MDGRWLGRRGWLGRKRGKGGNGEGRWEGKGVREGIRSGESGKGRLRVSEWRKERLGGLKVKEAKERKEEFCVRFIEDPRRQGHSEGTKGTEPGAPRKGIEHKRKCKETKTLRELSLRCVAQVWVKPRPGI